MSEVEAAPRPLDGNPAEAHRRMTSGYGWGYNNSGGLGIGSVARALVPVRVDVPEDTVDLQGGTDFTVAVTSTGRVWAWGGNRYGQLGDGSTTPRLTPHRVELPGHEPAASISAGADHVLVLSRHGSVFGWGHNRHGQLGNGSTADQHTPMRITTPHVTRLGTGVASSHAVTPDGAVLSWGRPVGGAATVGAGDQGTPGSFELPGGVKAVMVDAGERHLVVLARDGQLYTFGVDPGGRPLPVRMPTERSWGRVTSISAGNHHTVALTDSGTVLAWGANYYGQLGTRDTMNRAVPVPVRIPRLRGRIVDVVAGGNSVLARSSQGEVYAWGQGRFGQNGNGTKTDQTRPLPVDIPGQAGVTSVHTGRYHNVVLTARHR